MFALKYPQRISRLILNGANLNGKGVKTSVQIPIIIGYKIAPLFAKKSPEAKKNAEMLGLMVNDPNVREEELSQVAAKTLVIAGTRDMIKEEHTRRIFGRLPDARLEFVEGDHFIANRNSEVFNQVVREFLASE